MNICMFTNAYLPHVGGVARSVHRFARDLIDAGHRVLVVAPPFAGETAVSDTPPEVLRVPAIQQFNGSDFSVRIPVPFYIEQQIDAFSPDLVHSHHPFLLGDAAIRVARGRRLPLVFTHHTRYERYTHYVPLDSEVLQTFVVRLSTAYANLCRRVVAPSRSIVRLLRERGVERPIAEIPTGVDAAHFAAGDGRRFRRQTGLPRDAWVVGHVGRLAPEKNLDFLAEAVSRFMEDDAQAHFLVVGQGPSAERIERCFHRRSLTERLHLAGEADGERLRDAYAAMDGFAFASLTETQGMVLTEAMAAGNPVAALDAPGSREVVRDGRNGRLLPADASVDAFAAALKDLRATSGPAAGWRAEAFRTAQRFSRRVCLRKLEALYRSILEDDETGFSGDAEEMGPLDALAERIQTEWDLWSGKTGAVVEAIQAELKGTAE